jgi:glycosyltransferase involved in cell wall biosynthesis
MKQTRILLLADFGPETYTGYGTVSKNIVYYFEKMRKDVFFDIIGINHFKEGVIEGPNYRLISALLNDPKPDKPDEFGRYLLFDKIMMNDYEYVFIINDIGVVNPIMPIIEELKNKRRKLNRKSFKTVLYFPVDCELWPKAGEELLCNMHLADKLITYTNFGQKQIKKVAPHLSVSVIPHGVNTKEFFVLSDEDKIIFRKEFFGAKHYEKTIFASINRNQPRKDIVTTILAYEQLIKSTFVRREDCYLYLHMHPKDPLGNNLLQVLAQTDLEEGEDYDFIPPEFDNKMATVEELNKIYNSVDCVVLTTLGEGWGLTYHEASAVGTPVIYPVHTSLKEMSNNGAEQAIGIIDFQKVFLPTDNIMRWQSNLKKVEVGMSVIHLAKTSTTFGQIYERVQKAKEWARKHNWRDIVNLYWLKVF